MRMHPVGIWPLTCHTISAGAEGGAIVRRHQETGEEADGSGEG